MLIKFDDNTDLSEFIIVRPYNFDYNIPKLGKMLCNDTFSAFPSFHRSFKPDEVMNFIKGCKYKFEYIHGLYSSDKTGILEDQKRTGYFSLYICRELKLILQFVQDSDISGKMVLAGYIGNSYLFDEFYKDKVNDFIQTMFTTLEPKEEKYIPKINVVTFSSTDGYKLHEKKLSFDEISLEDNYNEDLKEIYSNMMDRLQKENDKGLVLLHGVPGTGKTTFIRHLCSKIEKKKIIYIPPELARQIADPSFLSFLINNSNSIIIVEDAEDLIQSRQTGRTSAVSNILNISDGLLSDVLNIQLICTFNCSINNIDDALLRKGRIISKYEFKELSLDKTKKLLPSATKPMTLADIYNYEDKSFNKKKERSKIGFEVND